MADTASDLDDSSSPGYGSSSSSDRLSASASSEEARPVAKRELKQAQTDREQVHQWRVKTHEELVRAQYERARADEKLAETQEKLAQAEKEREEAKRERSVLEAKMAWLHNMVTNSRSRDSKTPEPLDAQRLSADDVLEQRLFKSITASRRGGHRRGSSRSPSRRLVTSSQRGSVRSARSSTTGRKASQRRAATCAEKILERVPIPDAFFNQRTHKPVRTMRTLECTSVGIHAACAIVALLSFAYYYEENQTIDNTVVSPIRLDGFECVSLQKASIQPELSSSWTTSCSYDGNQWDQCLGVPSTLVDPTLTYFPDYGSCTLNDVSKWTIDFQNTTSTRNYSQLYTFTGYTAPSETRYQHALLKGQSNINATGWGYTSCASYDDVSSCPSIPIELKFEDAGRAVVIRVPVDVEQVQRLHINLNPGAEQPWCNCSGVQDIYADGARFEHSEPRLYEWHPGSQQITTQPSTSGPTYNLSQNRTDSPTNIQSQSPTNTPSQSPTNIPSQSPTNTPSQSPTNTPSQSPTNTPSQNPTGGPTNTPSQYPTNSPVMCPSAFPVCYSDGDCVIPSCAAGCTWSNGINYIPMNPDCNSNYVSTQGVLDSKYVARLQDEHSERRAELLASGEGGILEYVGGTTAWNSFTYCSPPPPVCWNVQIGQAIDGNGTDWANGKSVPAPWEGSSLPVTCPTVVNKTNWLGTDIYPDIFSISWTQDTVTAHRMDVPGGGWGMPLWFKCCADSFNGSVLAPQSPIWCASKNGAMKLDTTTGALSTVSVSGISQDLQNCVLLANSDVWCFPSSGSTGVFKLDTNTGIASYDTSTPLASRSVGLDYIPSSATQWTSSCSSTNFIFGNHGSCLPFGTSAFCFPSGVSAIDKSTCSIGTCSCQHWDTYSHEYICGIETNGRISSPDYCRSTLRCNYCIGNRPGPKGHYSVCEQSASGNVDCVEILPTSDTYNNYQQQSQRIYKSCAIVDSFAWCLVANYQPLGMLKFDMRYKQAQFISNRDPNKEGSGGQNYDATYVVGKNIWFFSKDSTPPVMKLDTNSTSVKYFSPAVWSAYTSCALVGTNLWCAPGANGAVLKLDTVKERFSQISGSTGFPFEHCTAYLTTVWCVSLQSENFVLKIDTLTESTSTLGYYSATYTHAYGSCTLREPNIFCAPYDHDQFLKIVTETTRVPTVAPTFSPATSNPTQAPASRSPTVTTTPTAAPTGSTWTATMRSRIGRFCKPDDVAGITQVSDSPRTYAVSTAMWNANGGGTSACNFSCACVPVSSKNLDEIKQGVLSRLKVRWNGGSDIDLCAPWKDLPPYVCKQKQEFKANSLFSSLSLAIGNITLFYFLITVLFVAWFSDPLGCHDSETQSRGEDGGVCCCCCFCGCCASWWCCRCVNGTFRMCCEAFFEAHTGPRDDENESCEDVLDLKGSIKSQGLASSLEMKGFGGRRSDRSFSLSRASDSQSIRATQRRHTRI